MTVPFDRVVEVRAYRDRDRLKVGSGFLVAPNLVLTAGHVVFADASYPVSRVDCRLATAGGWLTGRVAWPAILGDLDVALIKLTGKSRRAADVGTVRLGRLTGQVGPVHCETIGFPSVLYKRGRRRETDHLIGHVNPGAGIVEGRYLFNLDDTHPEPPRAPSLISPWAGMSGAALFSGQLLIGVIVIDTAKFGEGVLTAVPIHKVVGDSQFVAAMAGLDEWLDIESVELTDIFVLSWAGQANFSLTRLLGASAEVVPFRGRSALLEEYQTWCNSPEVPYGTRLLVGPGGQGKTRFAVELCQRMRRAGWIAGLVADDPPKDVMDRLSQTASPVVLAVDYAETRTDQVRRLVLAAWHRAEGPPIRLLLLARSAGEWWDDLQRDLPTPLESASICELAGLENTTAGRLAAYQEAQKAFVQRLAKADPEELWAEHAARSGPGDLTSDRFDSVLTLHMTALTNLLQSGPSAVAVHAGEQPEHVLLDHEQRYWERSAHDRGVLRRRDTLRRAVAAVTLCGSADLDEALRTLKRVEVLRDESDDDALREVCRWLHDLFPASSGRYWGPLQPDRLGEHLVELVASEEPHFIEDVLGDASPGQTSLAITVLARLGERHAQDGQLDMAKTWYRRAADHEHGDAAFRLGRLFEDEDDLGEAEFWYRRAVEDDHLDAAFRLGLLFQKNEQDVESERWLTAAALKGHIDAGFKLGELLRKSGGPVKAKPWFEWAADRSHANAAYQLSYISRDEGDRASQEAWLRRALSLAPESSQYSFRLAELLWALERREDAKGFYEHAAERNHGYAAYQRGYMYEEDGDLPNAQIYYERALHGAERKANEGLERLAQKRREMADTKFSEDQDG